MSRIKKRFKKWRIRSFSMNMSTAKAVTDPALGITQSITVYSVIDGDDRQLHAILDFWTDRARITAPTWHPKRKQWKVHYPLAAIGGVIEVLRGKEPHFQFDGKKRPFRVKLITKAVNV